jgi:hypothetical protein
MSGHNQEWKEGSSIQGQNSSRERESSTRGQNTSGGRGRSTVFTKQGRWKRSSFSRGQISTADTGDINICMVRIASEGVEIYAWTETAVDRG